MKRLLVLLSIVLGANQLYSQIFKVEELAVEIKEMNSPEFDWSQFDNDNAVCKYSKKGLTLECKKNNMFACTITELEFDVTNIDFVVSFKFEPKDLDDKHACGIVFDYENNKNFQALYLGKKQFNLVCHKDGEMTVIKEGLYKLSEKDDVVITLAKRGKRIEFYISKSYIPLTSLRNVTLKSSNIGFYVENKTKITPKGVGYKTFITNDEEVE